VKFNAVAYKIVPSSIPKKNAIMAMHRLIFVQVHPELQYFFGTEGVHINITELKNKRYDTLPKQDY